MIEKIEHRTINRDSKIYMYDKFYVEYKNGDVDVYIRDSYNDDTYIVFQNEYRDGKDTEIIWTRDLTAYAKANFGILDYEELKISDIIEYSTDYNVYEITDVKLSAYLK